MNTIIWLILIMAGISLKMANGFKVYWNVPTEYCQKFGIHFNLSTYHIIQNSQDRFHGEHINIIYNAGKFPYYEGTTPVWGGLPQKADGMAHIERFEWQVEQLVPLDFKGYVVLDFEAYEPDFDTSPKIYKIASREWVKQRHPEWPPILVEYMARWTFNQASKLLFTVLLEIGRVLRPEAKWGYYHYPYCKNWSPSLDCSSKQIKTNEEIGWLFRKSGTLYPSIYLFNKGPLAEHVEERMRRRLLNARQIRGSMNIPIIAYAWFKFHDDTEKYLDSLDLWKSLGVAWYLHMDGAIIWGSTDDVKSKKNCLELEEYTKRILGPLVKLLSQTSPSKSSLVYEWFERWSHSRGK